MTTDEKTLVDFQVVEDYYERLRNLNAEEVIDEVKKKVIGQDEFVSTFVSFLLLALRSRLELIAGASEDEVPRLTSAFVVGPTASGKSHAIRTICKALGVDFQFVDCTSLTGEGWRGNSVNNELAQLAQTQKSRPGIITLLVWDEADKMRYDFKQDCSFNPQHTFLKPLDGGLYHIEREGRASGSVVVDMNYVINVFAGAFTGIEDIVARRHRAGKASLGFTADASVVAVEETEALRGDIQVADFVEWGMLPELCGRCGAIFNIPALSCDDLAYIVKGSEFSLERKFARTACGNCSFHVSDGAVRLIVREAQRTGLGARGLENAMASVVGQANAAAAKEGAASMTIVDSDGVLAYRLGFDPAKLSSRAETGRRNYRRPCQQGDDELDQAKLVKRIGEGIDKRCPQFDLDYFLADPDGMVETAGVIARQIVGDDRSLDAVYREHALRRVVEILFRSHRLRRVGPCSLGRLYGEAMAAGNMASYGKEIERRRKALVRRCEEETAPEWNQLVETINDVHAAIGDAEFLATTRAVASYLRNLARRENFEQLKQAVYRQARSQSTGAAMHELTKQPDSARNWCAEEPSVDC